MVKKVVQKETCERVDWETIGGGGKKDECVTSFLCVAAAKVGRDLVHVGNPQGLGLISK